MPLKKWKKLRQSYELKNPWWTYRRDDVELPSGDAGEYHYVHVIGSSMVVPATDDGRLVMVNQYRYLADRESLEFPCGGVKEGSTYEKTARGELAEETGYAAGELDYAGQFNPYNGVTDEICRVYVARGLKKAVAEKDDTEEFELWFHAPEDLDALIGRGKIWDGMTLAAWSLVRERFIRP